MIIEKDKTISDNIKVSKFDHSNKTVSRDTKIKDYTQSFKCDANRYSLGFIGEAAGHRAHTFVYMYMYWNFIHMYYVYPLHIKIALEQRARWCSSLEKFRRRGSTVVDIYIHFIYSYILIYTYIRRNEIHLAAVVAMYVYICI